MIATQVLILTISIQIKSFYKSYLYFKCNYLHYEFYPSNKNESELLLKHSNAFLISQKSKTILSKLTASFKIFDVH